MKYCVLIDDDSDDRFIFSIAVEELKQKIIYEAFEGADIALKALKSNLDRVPDYIFLDLNMPRMNGKECLQILKSDEKLKNSQVVVYSTSKSPEDKILTKELGAKDYIVKPGSISELVQMIEKYVLA